jgi:hypothetical protein
VPVTVVAALADRSIVYGAFDGAARLAEVAAIRESAIPGAGGDFAVPDDDFSGLKCRRVVTHAG